MNNLKSIFHLMIGILFPCFLISQDITDSVDFGLVAYDSYVKIDTPVNFIKDTVLLYNQPTGKLHRITNHVASDNCSFVNIGGNFIEGKFSGKLYKSGNEKLNVFYKKHVPILLTTSDRTFTFKISGDKSVDVPLKFNMQDVNDTIFSKKYVTLTKKDSHQPIGQFELDTSKNKFKIKQSDLKSIKSGDYEGQVTLVQGNSELKQPIEIYKKDKFWIVFTVFIFSFIISYSFRYFAINEEKAIAYTEAKRLLKQIRNDTIIDPKIQKELLAAINYHIFEINGWLKDAAYYKQKLEEIMKAYDKAKPIPLLAYRSEIIEPISSLDVLLYGTKFTHVVITLLFCLLVFNAQYCDNETFGSDRLMDYLKLTGGVLVVVVASSGLIRDRIGLFQSELG